MLQLAPFRQGFLEHGLESFFIFQSLFQNIQIIILKSFITCLACRTRIIKWAWAIKSFRSLGAVSTIYTWIQWTRIGFNDRNINRNIYKNVSIRQLVYQSGKHFLENMESNMCIRIWLHLQLNSCPNSNMDCLNMDPNLFKY